MTDDYLTTHEIERLRDPAADVEPTEPERPETEALQTGPRGRRCELREVATGLRIEGHAVPLGDQR